MNNYGARNHVADALADLSVLEFGMNTKEKQHTKIMQTNLNTLCVIEENGIGITWIIYKAAFIEI